jgi:hypothetical protein
MELGIRSAISEGPAAGAAAGLDGRADRAAGAAGVLSRS